MSGKTLTDHSLFNSSLFWGIQYISIRTWMGNQTQKLKKNFDGSIELTWTTRFVHMFGQKQAKPRHKSGKTELWTQVYLPKANYKPTRPWQIIEVQIFWVWVFVEKNKRAGPDSLLYISWKAENVYLPTYIKRSKSIPFL